jgi:hypothetical protein
MAGAVTGSQEKPGVVAALTDREKAEILDTLITEDTHDTRCTRRP